MGRGGVKVLRLQFDRHIGAPELLMAGIGTAPQRSSVIVIPLNLLGRTASLLLARIQTRLPSRLGSSGRCMFSTVATLLFIALGGTSHRTARLRLYSTRQK